MENAKIEQLENKVLELASEIKFFMPTLKDREGCNYNHLGTLDVNLKFLRNRINALISELGYRE